MQTDGVFVNHVNTSNVERISNSDNCSHHHQVREEEREWSRPFDHNDRLVEEQEVEFISVLHTTLSHIHYEDNSAI